MSLPLSAELETVFEQSTDIARRVDQPRSSGHLLLAIFTVSNRAEVFLTDRNVDLDELLAHIEEVGREPDDTLDRILERGERIARGSQADELDSLDVLAAILRESHSQAHRLLRAADVDVAGMRATVMSYATGALSLPDSTDDETTSPETAPGSRNRTANESPDDAPSPISPHPSLGIDATPADRSDPDDGTTEPPTSGPTRGMLSNQPASDRDTRRSSQSNPDGWNTGVDTVPPDDDAGDAAPSIGFEESSLGTSTVDNRQTDEPTEGTDGAREVVPPRERSPSSDEPTASPEPQRGRDGSPTDAPGEESSHGDASDPSDQEPRPSGDYTDSARRAAESMGEQLFESSDPVAPEENDENDEDNEEAADDLDAPGKPDDSDDLAGGRATTLPPADQEEAAVRELHDPDLAERYRLDPDACPNLSEFGRNLTRQAALGRIDRVIGRDDEITRLIDIVGKRRANNPILVGEPGVGKTAIVEGLAREFVELAGEGDVLGDRTIIELELGRVLSGTQLRGELSERLMGLKDEVQAADGDVIVFLDEIHAWLDAGGSDGGDAAGELKTALARGAFPCIGATTAAEFRQFVEEDPAFERRFDVVYVEEPESETAIAITDGIRPYYEDHHDVRYTDDALEAAVELSRRYIHDRRLPDKAIGVLDLAGSRASRLGDESVDRQGVAEVVAENAGLPADRLTREDRERFLHIEERLREDIVGQRHVIDSVAEVIRRNYAGFRGERPIGSLLFLGPTGVGKTETVKALADFLFHDRDAVVQVDMSEFMKSHSVSRFVGAPPGYVGFDEGGQLTEAVRQRPYQVVLLDEIEKAHTDVLNVLLQLFEEGQLTDGKGRTVDFSNTVVVMTSNLGQDVFQDHLEHEQRARIGFGTGDTAPTTDDRDEMEEDVLSRARDHFTPELWNRIDERLVFHPLDRDEIGDIAERQLQESADRIRRESGVELEFGEGVVDHLIDNGGYDPKLGARPMRQTIQQIVEGEVARAILRKRADRGDTLRVACRGCRIECEVVE